MGEMLIGAGEWLQTAPLAPLAVLVVILALAAPLVIREIVHARRERDNE